MRNGDRFKAVLFDMDGVVLESMASHVAAWQAAFAEVDIVLENEFFYLNEGNLEWELLRARLNGCGREMTSEIFETLIVRQREIYNLKHSRSVRCYPEAVRLVEILSDAGVRLGLVTSSTRQVLPDRLVEWLDKYFDILITGDQVTRGKPHPEPYLTALSYLELVPGEAMVVENAPAGIQAAKAAEITCLALATTLPPKHLSAADYVMENHQALTNWLCRRFNILS